jgi:hypothetical protein
LPALISSSFGSWELKELLDDDSSWLDSLDEVGMLDGASSFSHDTTKLRQNISAKINDKIRFIFYLPLS